MICPNCRSEVPDGSKFCRVCGKPLPQSAQRGMRGGADPADDERTMGAYPVLPAAENGERTARGYPVQDDMPMTPLTPKPSDRARPAAGMLAAVIVLGVLLLASAGMNAYQYLAARRDSEDSESIAETLAQTELALDEANRRASESDSALAEKETELENVRLELYDAQDALEQANAEADDWRQRVEAAEAVPTEKAEIYDAIAAYTRGTNPGGASKIFKVSEPVIVMRTTDAPRTFTLTTDFYAGAIVEQSSSGDAATIAFTESSWGSTTPMTVTPNHAGTTVATFTNDYNTQVFTMLVIVVE